MTKTAEQAAPLLPPPPPQPCYGVPSPFQYHDDPPAYILLTAYPRRRRRHPDCRCCPSVLCSCLLFVLLLAAVAFFLWPTDPDVSVVHLRLDGVSVATEPRIRLDLSLGLEIKVCNPNFFALDYDYLAVSIWYRGSKLGFVTSAGGRVRARGVSYVDADLHLDGIQALMDVFNLIQDLARGSIPFDTITEVQGQLHLLAFDVPVQGRISCAVEVNTQNQTIKRQDCYPE